ncbi:hypothetical protein GNZ12_05485 [Paraburkholderia sp. 1N]|uniref:Uncharacterized protein n=1 Tax=Paraburkholderia solitsugae TaxID=2675748 RepID=A0ABX2BIZ9_9BURK|nr:hypothetical protein [Paraburkholderia solitsugae]NPT40774.1 hypothetical protein [Paraburkholderia solitsugae]
MIEDKDVAAQVAALLYVADRSVIDAIRVVQDKCPPEVLFPFRRGMGDVIYALYEKGIVPICRQHPHLIPEGETLDGIKGC